MTQQELEGVPTGEVYSGENCHHQLREKQYTDDDGDDRIIL